MKEKLFKVPTVEQLQEVFGRLPKIRNGKHTKTCRCYGCVTERLSIMEERFVLALRGGARITDPAQTVPVKAHFRKQQNHLRRDEWLRGMVEAAVRKVIAEQRKPQQKKASNS